MIENPDLPDERVRTLARDAFDHAQAARRDFTGAALALDDAELLARYLGEEWVRRAREAFFRAVRPVLAAEGAFLYRDGEILWYWVPAGLDVVVARVEQAFAYVARLELQTHHGPRHPSASAGLASSRCAEPAFAPRLCFETLVGVASEGLRVAANGGGGRHTHSELYGFLQSGLERRHPERLAEQARRVADLASVADGAARAGEEPTVGRTVPAPLPATEERATPPPTPRPVTSAAPPAIPVRAPRPDHERAAGELGAAVHELLAGLQAGAADVGVVERSLEALITERVERERREATSLAERRYGLEVDRLERRLHKLNTALEESEARALARRAAALEETGEASAYRTVQGLSAADEQFERKRQLMEEIFVANLEFQAGR